MDIGFTANSIKWYATFDDYKDIQMFEKFSKKWTRDQKQRKVSLSVLVKNSKT